MANTLILQSGNKGEAIYSVDNFHSIQLVVREIASLEPSTWLVNTLQNIENQKIVKVNIHEKFLLFSSEKGKSKAQKFEFINGKRIDFDNQFLLILVGYDKNGSIVQEIVEEICVLPSGLKFEQILDYSDETQSFKKVFPLISVQRFFPAFKQTGFDFIQKSVFVSGSGTGGELLALRYLGAQAISGVEPNTKARNIALKYTKPFEEIQIFENSNEIPAESKFDYVISRHVLEHVPAEQREKYVLDLLLKLKPTGELYIEVPNQDCPIEPHTDLLFFHWLTEERKVEAKNYFEKMEQMGLSTPVQVERLKKIIGHTNISLEELLTYIPNGYSVSKYLYTDSAFIYNESSATT